MKILILNGDSSSNRGDRAILLGNILLLKKSFPNSEVRAFSYYPERDEEWYNIKFYDRSSVYAKIKSIFWSDVIMWGGGELIQDDTSKVKIPYWFFNILILSFLFRKKIVALGQGLGPVKSRINKVLTKLMVNRLYLFFSRDNYSKENLRKIGVKVPIISSYDPAILVSDEIVKSKSNLSDYLTSKGFKVEKKDKIVGVGVRRWFHHSGSWIPHKYAFKYGLRKIPGEKEFTEMKRNLAKLLDNLVRKKGFKVVFFPMYTPKHESDDVVSEEVLNLMKEKEKGFVIKDDFSPLKYSGLIFGTDLFFGIRLHSTILSSSLGIPSLTFYYVEKGKSYFEQIKIPECSFKIDDLLSSKDTEKDLAQFEEVIKNKSQYANKILASISSMKENLINDGKKIKNYL